MGCSSLFLFCFCPESLGQWILNIYPECIGDLKSLGKAEFPMCETPLESTSDLGAAYNCHEC